MSDKKRLLVIVDFQNDFIDGSLGFPGAADIEGRLLDLIDEFEKKGDDVVFTKDIHSAEYLQTEEGRNLPVVHCLYGSEGSKIHGQVGIKSTRHRVFIKDTFGSRGLFDFLLKNDYKEIVLAGLVSTICVLSNAVIAKTALPNAHIIVDRLGSASPDKEAEEKTYDVLRGIHVEIR